MNSRTSNRPREAAAPSRPQSAHDKAFRRFMRATTKPVVLQDEWHAGLLTRDLWEAMSYQPRRELMDLVNAAVIQVARKYYSGA